MKRENLLKLHDFSRLKNKILQIDVGISYNLHKRGHHYQKVILSRKKIILISFRRPTGKTILKVIRNNSVTAGDIYPRATKIAKTYFQLHKYHHRIPYGFHGPPNVLAMSSQELV